MSHEPSNEYNPEFEKIVNSFVNGEGAPNKNQQDTSLAEANCQMIKFMGLGSLVTFADNITPMIDGGDPSRKCSITGTILEYFEDEDIEQSWTIINVTKHILQLTSNDEVLPGSIEMFNQAFSDPADFNEAMDVFKRFEFDFPETATFIELEIQDNPRKFLLKDMSGCVFSHPKE